MAFTHEIALKSAISKRFFQDKIESAGFVRADVVKLRLCSHWARLQVAEFLFHVMANSHIRSEREGLYSWKLLVTIFRASYHSTFSIGMFSNRWMAWAVGVFFLVVLLVVYVPFLRLFFGTVPPGINDWLLMMPFFFASPLAMELLKMHFRKQAS